MAFYSANRSTNMYIKKLLYSFSYDEITTHTNKGDNMRKTIAHRRASDGVDQSVLSHLNEVGDLAEKFAAKANLSEQGKLLGLLHDFGKYSEAFQNYIKSGVGDHDVDDTGWVDSKSLKGKVDHSTAGAQYIWNWCSVRSQKTGHGELVGQILAICIASHHSGLINCISVEGEPVFKNRMEKPDSNSHLLESTVLADKALIDSVDELLNTDFLKHFFKIIKLDPSNWSITEAFRVGMLTRFLFSCLIDADRLNSSEFETPQRKTLREKRESYYDWDIPINRLEAKLESFSQANSTEPNKINNIRADIADDCLKKSNDPQGIFTLSVPTGGGKTLASLRYALHHARKHELDRIIYIIPYTSIIEQNAAAIREIVEDASDPFDWVLEHHSNLEPKDAWRSKLVAENWDAPIVFTTMVQFLEVLFSGGTRSVRRLHQLANAVVVFDEIQTLPINCTHLFCNAINFLSQQAKTTTVLCTATQPLLDQLNVPEKGQLVLAQDHEIVRDKEQLFSDLSRVTINNRCKQPGWSTNEITELAIENYQRYGSCLIIVNTKVWAKTLYQHCSETLDEKIVFHLSTNQCAAHRQDMLKAIRERLDNKQPVLCISTQLIEAGVDVDFAYVIRFVAGLDSIAQAAGRCNRNGKLTDQDGKSIKGQVDVVNPDKETIQSLVEIKEGQDITFRLFDEASKEKEKDLLAPELMKRYFELYFFNRKEDMSYPTKTRKNQAGNLLNWLSDNKENIGRQNMRNDGEGRQQQGKVPLLEQSFKDANDAFKAIDSQAKPVIVPYEAGAELITQLCGLAKDFQAKEYYEALKAAQKYTVNVFPNVWRKLEVAGALHETKQGEGIYFLDEQNYSKDYGINDQRVSNLNDMNL